MGCGGSSRPGWRILLPVRAHISELWPSPLVLSNDSCRPGTIYWSLFHVLRPTWSLQFQCNCSAFLAISSSACSKTNSLSSTFKSCYVIDKVMYENSPVAKQLHCQFLRFYLSEMCAEMKKGSYWLKPKSRKAPWFIYIWLNTDTHFRHQLTMYIPVDCRLVVQLCSCEDLIFRCQHVHWVLVQ